jgi:toxin ParE1/3/4
MHHAAPPELFWTPTAQRELRGMVAFVRPRNPAAATRLFNVIVERAEQLPENPEIGRPGRLHDTRELIVSGTPYLLIYRIRGEAIDILRVLHGKRDWPPGRRKTTSPG